MKICVLGAGAWGTALAVNAAGRHSVTLWARDAAQVAAMATSRENTRYLPGTTLPASLSVVHGDAQTATAGADLVGIAKYPFAIDEDGAGVGRGWNKEAGSVGLGHG
ncbi:MAG: hypothetical protein EOO77_43120 [Oxalobacteraceae bacterium]|nr:MAG: hypothetical protein EOO77_43120 [Oxalobacteraceae bacterium]